MRNLFWLAAAHRRFESDITMAQPTISAFRLSAIQAR